MNEQPIRIILSTTTTAFKRGPDNKIYQIQKPMIFQKGRRLPQPDGEPADPIRIVDIVEFEGDAESGEDSFFMVFSVAEDGTPAQQADMGFVTKVPADLVIRKDSRVSATEMLLDLKRMQAEAEEPPQVEQATPVSGPPVAPPAPTNQQVHVAAPSAQQAPVVHHTQVQAPPPPLPPELSVMDPPPPPGYVSEPQEPSLLDASGSQEDSNASHDGQ